MKAVILAAGEGQRLRPFTANKPKVMIKVGNRPILQYVVNALAEAGVRELFMIVGYKKDRVMSHFGNGSNFGVEIEYVIQKQQLGTAHALKQVEKVIEGDFLVVSGDNIIDSKTVTTALNSSNSIVYKNIEESSKYGVLKLKEDGIVDRIIEKPKEEVSYLANTGVYSLNEEVFNYIGEERELTAVINKMIESGVVFRAFETDGVWIDIVYPWDIPIVNEFALKGVGKQIRGKVESNVVISGDVVVGERCVIRSGTYIRGPAILGEGCEVGPNAVIGPGVSIGNNTRVEPFSVIQNSVIGDNVIIGSGSKIESSVVDSGTRIMSGFTAVKDRTAVDVNGHFVETETGAFIGERCIIGARTVAMPGTIVGNDVTVSPLKVLSGKIPDEARVI